MLTKSDLQSIGKVIDLKLKEIASDISAIQARVADIEDAQVRKLDILELRSMIRSVDKRVAAIEGRFLKSATKDDIQHLATKDDLQKELKPIKTNINKIRKDLKMFTRFFDSEHIELEKRVDRLEKYKNRPSLGISS